MLARSKIQLGGASTSTVVLLPLTIIAALSGLAVAHTPLTLPQAVSMALDKNPSTKLRWRKLVSKLPPFARPSRRCCPGLPSARALCAATIRCLSSARALASRTSARLTSLSTSSTRPRRSATSPAASPASGIYSTVQSWYGVTRAKYMKQAAEQQLDRADQELV
jgi:hypothetical protein